MVRYTAHARLWRGPFEALLSSRSFGSLEEGGLFWDPVQATHRINNHPVQGGDLILLAEGGVFSGLYRVQPDKLHWALLYLEAGDFVEVQNEVHLTYVVIRGPVVSKRGRTFWVFAPVTYGG